MQVNKSKYRKITYKIIDYKTLKKICNTFSSLKENEEDIITIKAYSRKNEVYTSKNCKNFFDSDSDIMHKFISGINLTYCDKSGRKKVSLSLYHKNSSDFFGFNDYIDNFSFNNKLKVEGNDESWADATFIKINSLIDSFKDQNKFTHKYKFPLIIIFSFFFGIFLLFLLNLSNEALGFLNVGESKIKDFPRDFEWIGLISFIIVAGIIPAYKLQSRIMKLWPIVEFHLCREHMKLYKNRRKNLYIAITVFILPVLLFSFS